MYNTGELYGKIADWCEHIHIDSDYGMKKLEFALRFVKNKDTASDIGCGTGVRMIEIVQKKQ